MNLVMADGLTRTQFFELLIWLLKRRYYADPGEFQTDVVVEAI